MNTAHQTGMLERILTVAFERPVAASSPEILKDPLTGVYNQRGFEILAAHAIRKAICKSGRMMLLRVREERLDAIRRESGADAANALLCLRVADMAQARAELLARGVATTEPREKGNGRRCSLRDPDGNEICLWEYFQS